MLLSEWLDLNAVALSEAHSAVLDTAAVHIAAAAIAQGIVLNDQFAAVIAAADAVPPSPALTAALIAVAQQAAFDSALATVSATTDSLLLRTICALIRSFSISAGLDQ
jgi:hypothetical protein